MSHTSTINAVVISDVAALRAAIDELKRNGVKCDLLENAVPRAYYTNQAGLEQAPYVVQLHDARYDVGLYAREDGKGFEARADLFLNSVQGQIGSERSDGESHEQAAMGKLFNLYAVHAATRKATQQGYRVTRINKANGAVQLQIAA